MKYLVIFCFTIFLINSSHACELVTYGNIVKLAKKKLDTNVIKSSKCTKEVQAKFLEFVEQNSGVFSAKQLGLYFDPKISFTPGTITIQNLQSYLQNKYADKDILFEDIKVIGDHSAYLFDNQHDDNLNCKNCPRPGFVNFNLKLNDSSPIWGSAILKVAQTAFVARKDLTFNTHKLERKFFKKMKIYTDHPEMIFTDYEDIKFYKLNRNLITGRSLSKTDVSTTYLVRMGEPVKIFFDGKGIQLSTIAIATRSGRLGDIIEFKNNNNKKIYAQIVDFNKAKISL